MKIKHIKWYIDECKGNGTFPNWTLSGFLNCETTQRIRAIVSNIRNEKRAVTQREVLEIAEKNGII